MLPLSREPLEQDNNIRKNSTLADYQKLRPAFDRKHGTVTAANSTPLTDGAAAVILMTESRAKELGLEAAGLSAQLRLYRHRRLAGYAAGARVVHARWRWSALA